MRKLGLGLAVIGLAVPSFLQAVGLGEISVDSYLNQPLVADIQLVSTSASEVDSLQVKLAPDKIFQQIGIQRTGIHSQLDFKPVIKNGVPVITVTTTRAITEPFLNFVIEVAWPKGKLLREYTVLLDPPVFRQQQAPAVTAPAAVEPAQEIPPVISETPETTPETTEVMVSEPEQPVLSEVPPPVDPLDSIPLAETFPVTEPVPVDSADTQSSVAEEIGSAQLEEMPYQSGAEYEVQRGDTLYEIADSYRPENVTVNQMMIALLRENPKAFVAKNINRLKSGYIMRVPDEGAVESISNAEALAEVKQQRALWTQYKERLAAAAVPQQPAIEETTEPAAEPAADTESAEALEAVAEQAEKAGSELEIVVPDEESDKAQEGQEGTVLADAGATADLEKEVTLAKEQIESQARENEELRSRVGELEALLNDKDRLIELKDEQLLDIQQKLGDVEEAAQVPAVAPEAPETTSEQPAETAEPAEAGEPATDLAPSMEEQIETAPAAEEPVVEQPTAEEPIVEETAAEEPIVEEPAAEEPPTSASSELMPRIPIDTTAETMPEQAAIESTAEVAEQEPPVTEPVQTAANDAMEEKPGFFKALLNNPNLLMGAGFGALLLAGLGWLVARRKNTAELEVPNITRAPTLEGFTRDDDFVGESEEAVKEDVAEIESLLDIPEAETEIASGDQVAEDAQSQDELNDFIDSAFNIESDEQPDDAVASLATEDEFDIEPGADEIEAVKDENLISMDEAENPVDDQMVSMDVDDVAPALDAEDVAPELDTDDVAPALDAEDLAPELDTSTELTDFIKEEIPESDEVLAEADVYLAYGLNEQAIELLKPSLLDHPERHDYRGKLLEALYAMEDKNGFLEEAETLKTKLGNSAASSTIWGRVVAMGKDIAPDSELYAADVAKSASLDDISPKKPESIDIDLGSDEFLKSDLEEDELKETVIRGEGKAEFAVPDNDLAYQDTQAIDPEDMALALEEFDLPEIDPDSAETLMMDGATLHGLELTPMESPDQPEPSGDATDEFKFDVSALEDVDVETFSEQEASDIVVQPDSTQVMDESDIDEDQLSASMEMTQAIDPDTAMTAQTDMTDLELAKETLAINVLDEGEGEGEISLLTGEDEIDTKLDLAKAYIDMGDQEGAKDALDEVINSGSDEQRTEAEKLLQQIG